MYTFSILRLLPHLTFTVVFMIIAAPFMIVAVAICLLLNWLVRRVAVLPAQNMEWLESECRGPINTKFGSIIDGLMTVRAYHKQQYFLDNYMQDSDRVS